MEPWQRRRHVLLTPRRKNIFIKSHGSQAHQREASQGKDAVQPLSSEKEKDLLFAELSGRRGSSQITAPGENSAVASESLQATYSCLEVGCYNNSDTSNVNNTSVGKQLPCF